MTPKPRNAKKVSATLETICRSEGYPEKASRSRSMFDRVATENTVRMPTTTMTTTVCALATTWEPKTLSPAMTSRTRIANPTVQSVLSATAELA